VLPEALDRNVESAFDAERDHRQDIRRQRRLFRVASMSNLVRMWNAWCLLTLQAARLAWEAQGVVVLRCMRIAGESARGRQSEAHRMVSEKVAALTEAQAAATTAAIEGGGHRVVKKVLGVYKKRVRRNKQRLTPKLGRSSR
jgi:hypothetical protein